MMHANPRLSEVEAAAREPASSYEAGIVAAMPIDPTRRLIPEQRLMVAILANALATIRRYAPRRDRVGRRALAEALRWVSSDAVDSPFAFVVICEVLDLDPHYIRRGLMPSVSH